MPNENIQVIREGETEENSRYGLLVVCATVFVLPLVIAVWFGALALAAAAWNLFISQVVG